ncbi:MAG: phosphoribosylanthranilate isomerase [Aquificota bacterium]|nr:MAG: phosphoribosylanthranilate isomerase [Aquificota bacterium]
MIVKVCGITTPEQAKIISTFEPTHIGVVYFEKSPRHIDIKRIKDIKKSISESIKLTAVVVNPDEETVEELLKVVDVIQFHGDETVEFVLKFPSERVIKAFRIKEEKDLDKIIPFAEAGIITLIDAFTENAYGGTGKRINPELAKKAINRFKKVVLSGGLSDENIEEILDELKPYGVDASSKLEIKPGLKDIVKVKKFVEKAKRFYQKTAEAAP